MLLICYPLFRSSSFLLLLLLHLHILLSPIYLPVSLSLPTSCCSRPLAYVSYMAVQAQYPSNILLINSSGGQEGCAYSLQAQTGQFLDQSQLLMFSNNGGTRARKRGREGTPINDGFAITAPKMEPHHLRHPQPRTNVVYTGLRLSSVDQNNQISPSKNQQDRHQQDVAARSSAVLLTLLSDDFSYQIKRQREEIDQFLHLQAEQLRAAIAEKRQKQYHALLLSVEESMQRRYREREEQVETAVRRSAELEARAAQLSVEVQLWEAKARAQEATAASLQVQLQQAVLTGATGSSSVGFDATGADDAESSCANPDREMRPRSRICAACRSRALSVVALPCRHLCLCPECDLVAQSCPICFQFKNSSVQVSLQ